MADDDDIDLGDTPVELRGRVMRELELEVVEQIGGSLDDPVLAKLDQIDDLICELLGITNPPPYSS